MNIIPKEQTKCSECIWASFLSADFVLGCGYVCKLNPFKNIVMGLFGTHGKRKRKIEEAKEERKNIKKGSSK